MPLFHHNDNTQQAAATDPRAANDGGLSQPMTGGQPMAGEQNYAATGPGVTGEHHNHHLGRDAAVGAGAVGLAEHEHHKHQANATGAGTGMGMGSGPGTSTTTGGNHHLGRDAALGAGAVGVAEHEHHKHHGHATGATGTTGTTGVGHHPGVHDPATMAPEGNPLYPSPHAPVADGGLTGTGTGMGGHTGTGVGTGAATHSSQVTTSSGKSPSTQAMIGKVEAAVGTILHSETLKAKGIAKQEEAVAVKAQKAELTEAERLEGHAGMARDRAAAHAATGNVHGHAREAIGTYGAGPTQVGETTTAGGIQGVGGAGAARPF